MTESLVLDMQALSLAGVVLPVNRCRVGNCFIHQFLLERITGRMLRLDEAYALLYRGFARNLQNTPCGVFLLECDVALAIPGFQWHTCMDTVDYWTGQELQTYSSEQTISWPDYYTLVRNGKTLMNYCPGADAHFDILLSGC